MTVTVAAACELRGCEKTYPTSAAPVHALRDCNLRIERGEFVALVGPSGSGKSTLLNLLGLLDTPTSGTVHIEGCDVAALTDAGRTALRGRRIGIVYQSFQLLQNRRALENVSMAFLYRGRDMHEAKAASGRALETVGLSHKAAVEVQHLSGGEQQRVAIARAIAGDPALLLCDEPTGNLDSENTAGVVDLLGRLNRQGTAIVMITHDVDVARTADRVLGIVDGRLTDDEGPTR